MIRRRLAAVLFASATLASHAAADPCEPHKAKYGAHPLSLAGSITLKAKEGAATDADMQCLEKLWNPKDGTIAATATRALLMVTSRHPSVAMQAATRRPEIYREWMADLARYGLHDVNGEGQLLRRGIAQLLTARPTGNEAAGHKLLLDGLAAVQPFKLD